MTPAARLSAAIDILAGIADLRVPVGEALKDWGRRNRYAGAKDRTAIASLIYDALRTRASSAWIMGEDSARATMLGALKVSRGLDAAAISTLCSGERYAPAPLTDEEDLRVKQHYQERREQCRNSPTGLGFMPPRTKTLEAPEDERNAAFEEAIQRGLATVIRHAKGFQGFKVNRGIESKERYILQIFWDTLEDHNVGFRQSPAFAEWRAIVARGSAVLSSGRFCRLATRSIRMSRSALSQTDSPWRPIRRRVWSFMKAPPPVATTCGPSLTSLPMTRRSSARNSASP